MKKYSTDFVKQLEDQKKNYSPDDYQDMLCELQEALNGMIKKNDEELLGKADLDADLELDSNYQ